MEAYVVARPELRCMIGRDVAKDGDHRVSTGDRMIGEEDQGLSAGRDLDCPTDQTF